MSKDTKRTFFSFLPYECAAAEEYLELMAEKGWLLQSVKGMIYKFKKTEHKNIKYSVDVLHKVSVFDGKDSDVALEYREYCKAAGWSYVCQIGKIKYFIQRMIRKLFLFILMKRKSLNRFLKLHYIIWEVNFL